MKQILTISLLLLSNIILAQTLQAKIDTKGKIIEGLCNQNEYYHLMNGMGNQQEAACPISNEEIYDKLLELTILKENPKFKGEEIINVDINCKGEVVNVDSEFKDEELNKQIKNLFLKLGNYNPGQMEGKNVDCSILYSIKIKNGTLTLNNNRWKK
jgi:hypothetical protein